MNELQQVAQALGIALDSPLQVIVEHIRVLRTNFKQQVLVASRLPVQEEIEGQGPPIGAQPTQIPSNLPTPATIGPASPPTHAALPTVTNRTVIEV